ncbi:MAG: hypothetical protein WKF83_01520 [Nocardioidaceae bacterium]
MRTPGADELSALLERLADVQSQLVSRATLVTQRAESYGSLPRSMSEWPAGIINELTVADSFYVDHTMLGLGVDSAYAWRAEPPEDADRVPSWLAVPAAEVIEAYRHPRPDAARVRAGWERSTRADPLRLTVARSQGGVSRRSTKPRPARNARHSSSPPVGALVFWQTDSSGHVALYAGDGKAYSNDFVENGCIDLTDMDAISVSATYLGWAEPAFPVQVRDLHTCHDRTDERVSPMTTDAEHVPTFPKVEAVVRPDGSGEVTVQGTSYPIQAASVGLARHAVTACIVDNAARTMNRAVRVRSVDVDGSVWTLIVHPDGRVESAGDEPRTAPAAAVPPAPDPVPSGFWPASRAPGARAPTIPQQPAIPPPIRPRTQQHQQHHHQQQQQRFRRRHLCQQWRRHRPQSVRPAPGSRRPSSCVPSPPPSPQALHIASRSSSESPPSSPPVRVGAARSLEPACRSSRPRTSWRTETTWHW